MNDHLIALVLGLIEGLTEFLPISSTGHLLIAEHWLGRRSDLFNIVIQSGAIVAVTLVYRERLWQLARSWREPFALDYIRKAGVAFAVTAALGLVVARLGFRLPETVAPIAVALIVGGAVILFAEGVVERRAGGDGISWRIAIVVGLAQVLAGVFPGTSRSAAAIFGALLAGAVTRSAATEFAFIVGIPTLFAASGWQSLKYYQSSAAVEPWDELAIAFAAASLSGFIVVRWLLGYIRNHRYSGFAWYRIALGVALLAGLPAGA